MTNYSNDAALAVAKQIATFNGQIFDKLGPPGQARLVTLANSIIATVKRLEKKK